MRNNVIGCLQPMRKAVWKLWDYKVLPIANTKYW